MYSVAHFSLQCIRELCLSLVLKIEKQGELRVTIIQVRELPFAYAVRHNCQRGTVTFTFAVRHMTRRQKKGWYHGKSKGRKVINRQA